MTMIEMILIFLIIMAIILYGRLSYNEGHTHGYQDANTDLEIRLAEAYRKGSVISLLKLQQMGLIKQEEDGSIIGLNNTKWHLSKDEINDQGNGKTSS